MNTQIVRLPLLTSYHVQLDGFRLSAHQCAEMRVRYGVFDQDGSFRGTICRVAGKWIAYPPSYVRTGLSKLPEFQTPQKAMASLLNYSLLSF